MRNRGWEGTGVKFLFASDSFKGSLSSEKTGELLERRQKRCSRTAYAKNCRWQTAVRERWML